MPRAGLVLVLAVALVLPAAASHGGASPEAMKARWRGPEGERHVGRQRRLSHFLDQGDPARVQAFVADRTLMYPVARDAQMAAATQFGVRGLPATLLVGADGHIEGVTYGPKEWDGKGARELIASLLPAKKGASAR